VLGAGLRRPLQAGLWWLAARARGDDAPGAPSSTAAPGDAALLDRARKMLTEIDVYDDATAPPASHTHAKFRAAFGPLLLRDRAAERLGLRERC
jgi:hypothetical protein